MKKVKKFKKNSEDLDFGKKRLASKKKRHSLRPDFENRKKLLRHYYEEE